MIEDLGCMDLFRGMLERKSPFQPEKWNGTLLKNNESCKQHGANCLQILGMHVLSSCDTVSYPYGKRQVASHHYHY